MVSAIGLMAHALHTMMRDLHRPRGRERRQLCLAEGVRLVEEALAADVPIRGAVVSPTLEGTERGVRLKAALAARADVVEPVTDAELAELAATEHPQGVVAALAYRSPGLDRIEVGPRSVVVVLDALQDPGNVGTIIRTARALGAAGVVCLPGTAEITNPKTLRATMGAVFRLPVVPAAEADLVRWIGERGLATVAAEADGAPFDPARLPRPLALVLGNEGAGARSALAAGAAHRLAIPLVTGAESLNVAVAAGIFLYGATRA
jgi:RNA methyltransferase, TrmH family